MNTFGRLPKGAALEKIKESSNFVGNTFRNPLPTKMKFNPFTAIKEYASRKGAKPGFDIPVSPILKTDFSEKISHQLKLSWLGHASLVIEIEGLRMLLDPVFCQRVSPFKWSGPKRLHKAPLKFEELPDIDVILISHNHYDHMDYELIRKLADRNIQFLVPLALGETLRSWGIKSAIQEFDWGDSFKVKDITFRACPARHFTSRKGYDQNKTFWASWCIEGQEHKIFFSGDSGAFPGFGNIGEQYGPFDLSMIGIGAYNPMWAHIHTNPSEAIDFHESLQAEYLLPIHWCTFDLAPHPWAEPINWLVREAAERNTKLILPTPGEWINWGQNYPTKHWWKT